MLNGPSAISFYPFGVGAGQSVLLSPLCGVGGRALAGRKIAQSFRTASLVAEPPFWGSSPTLLVFPSQEDRFAGRCPKAARFGFSWSWLSVFVDIVVPLFCGRGLGLGPQGRDPLVSGSTSLPSIRRSLSLVRERTHTTTS